MADEKKDIMASDMSQIELKMMAVLNEQQGQQDVDMNTHLSLVTGLERRAVKALRFSEVFGNTDTRETLLNEQGKAHVIRMTLDFLEKFPATTQAMKFRKERSRMMLKALVNKVAKRRNTEIIYDGICFRFIYKGNPILTWDVDRDETKDVFVEKYNDAPSTLYQRTLARESIHEFRKVVLNV